MDSCLCQSRFGSLIIGGNCNRARPADKPDFASAPLNAVSQIELGFPTGFLHRPLVRDFLHGGLLNHIKSC